MSSEALGNKRRARAPDVPNAPDPRPEDTSAADEYLGMGEEDVQEDYCGKEESEVDNALEAGGREGEGATRGQESRLRENSKEHLGPQEMEPFNAGSPAPSHIGGCRTTFPFAVAESPKIGEAGGEVSEPKRTSRGRVKRVVTLPASFASGARPIPPTCTRNYPSMSSLTTAEGDKRGLQQREERQTVLAIIRRIEEMEYKEQAAKAGAWSTGLEGRVGHASGKVGEKRRFGDACDTGWGEAAEEGPRGEGDDGSQPERGKEAEAAGPKLDQAERQNKKLRRDSEDAPRYVTE